MNTENANNPNATSETADEAIALLANGDFQGFCDAAGLYVKMNPYHDERGRFTSGGAGGSTAMAPDKDSGSGVASSSTSIAAGVTVVRDAKASTYVKQRKKTINLKDPRPDKVEVVKDALNDLPDFVRGTLEKHGYRVEVHGGCAGSNMGACEYNRRRIGISDNTTPDPRDKGKDPRSMPPKRQDEDNHHYSTTMHECAHAHDIPPEDTVGKGNVGRYSETAEFKQKVAGMKGRIAEKEPLETKSGHWTVPHELTHYINDPREAYAQGAAIAMMRRANNPKYIELLKTDPTLSKFAEFFPDIVDYCDSTI